MSKSMKIWIIIAIVLILIGGLIFGGTMSAIKWDFKKLGTNKIETNTYEVTEKFNNISINSESTDVIFMPSDNKECKVVCTEETNAKHSVKVENNTLVIELENKKEWFENIGIHVGDLKMTVYLPKSEYEALSINVNTGDIEIPEEFKFDSIDTKLTTGDIECLASGKDFIKVKVSTGDVFVKNVETKSLELSGTTGDMKMESVVCNGDVSAKVSSGKVDLNDVKCNNLNTHGTTGDVSLKNVVAKTNLSVERSTGDVTLEKSDAQDIYIKVTTGNVTGSLLSEKVFIIDVTTGQINVPHSTTGGICEIEATTGSVNITIED